MVFITGDTHGSFEKLSHRNFPEGKRLTKNDYVIICGDFGLWHPTTSEDYWLQWLEQLQFNVCWCDGNHENFDRIYSDEFQTIDFHGGKAQKIRDNVFHLMRGEVFNIDGCRFFAFGGASSHDIEDGILDPDEFKSDEEFVDALHRWRKTSKRFRVNHHSWWKDELPSSAEMQHGIESLQQNGFAVDYVVSHCLPTSASKLLGYYGSDILTDYFDRIVNDYQLDFNRWYCGHYHRDISFGQFTIKYHDIERVV